VTAQIKEVFPGIEEGLIDEGKAHRYQNPRSSVLPFMILAWPKKRTVRFVFFLALPLLLPLLVHKPAQAKEVSPDQSSRVAVLAPKENTISPRLERNITSMSLTPTTGTVVVCTRQAGTRLIDDLDAGSALCADSDKIGVWVRDGDHLILKEVIVSQSADDRGQEVTAARAAMVLRAALAKRDTGGSAPGSSGSGSITIIANGPGSGSIVPSSLQQPAGKDAAPAAPPAPKPPRIAPKLVFGLGPGAMASRHGTSFAIHAEAEIGFSRNIALVPWLNFVPANRQVERPEGSAEFRPTIFGLGFAMPFLPNSSWIVPRLGGGYGLVWMHVAPNSAAAPAVARKPEDLLAPMMYVSASVSVAVAKRWRVAAEGLGGITSHDMVVRIARQDAAHWGVPLGGLSLRGEFILE